MESNENTHFSFVADEFLDFMSFPELDIVIDQAYETKKNDITNPLQNGVQEISADLHGKTYANLTSTEPAFSDEIDNMYGIALKPEQQILVWSEVKDNSNTNSSSIQEPQPLTPAIHSKLATPSIQEPHPLTPAIHSNLATPSSIQEPQPLTPAIHSNLATPSSIQEPQPLTPAIHSKLATPSLTNAGRTSASPFSAASKQIHSVTSPYTNPRQSSPKIKVPPIAGGKKKTFLWQRSEKFDNPEKEKSRLDAIKAKNNRAKEKERNQELLKKLEDAVNERDELKQKLLQQDKAEREKKLNFFLKKTLQKNKTLEKENNILRHYLSQALEGNLQLVIKTEEKADSTQIVSELVQLSSESSVI
ncbi:hypothetical protein SK128_023949 [Halocaridina rubra]|uniref:Uncharacterized protein n=1 Tax=Halocaridina rubra TaxID=373956 RepID=A0AAN8X8R7_HALRR